MLSPPDGIVFSGCTLAECVRTDLVTTIMNGYRSLDETFRENSSAPTLWSY